MKLHELKNYALAMLENGGQGPNGLEQTESALEEIISRSPLDRFGPRNLLIARWLRIELQPPEQIHDSDLDLVRQAIDLVAKVEPDSAESHYILGRIVAKLGDVETALSEFQEASRQAPNDPAMAFAAFNYLSGKDLSEEQQAVLGASLVRTSELDPTNISATCQQLVWQAQHRDKEIAATLERLQALLTKIPFLAERINRRAGVDVKGMIDQVKQDAAAQDWEALDVSAYQVRNQIVADDLVRNDQRRLDRHPLEYVVLDFEPPLQREIDSTVWADQDIEVALGKLPGEAASVPTDKAVAAAVCNFNLADYQELVVLEETSVVVLGHDDMIGAWSEMTRHAIPAGYDHFQVVDLDYDYLQNTKAITCQKSDLDLILYGPAGILLLENRWSEQSPVRKFEIMEQSAEFQALRDVAAVAVADIHHDGDLDLVISSRETGVSIWSNTGQGKFTNISDRSEMPPPQDVMTALVPVDWDRDADLDVLCFSADGNSGILENFRHAELRFRQFEGQYSRLNAASASVADLNADASWDLVLSGPEGLRWVETRLKEPGEMELVAIRSIDPAPSKDHVIWDYNNDGQLDLLSLGDSAATFWQGKPRGTFVSAKLSLPEETTGISGAVAKDIDEDGDQDLLLVADQRVIPVDNVGGNSNRWVNIEVVALYDIDQQTSHFKVNDAGIGSILEMRGGPLYQAQTITGHSTHFGIGRLTAADAVRIIWTNGVTQQAILPRTNTVLCEQQQLKGSCPYLYAFDGEKFVFVTDLLWSAPLGLQIAEGKVAPCREWEYLKVPGELLAESNGVYSLRLTEELWEAAYFDQVELFAVDHPAEVEIFTNEKVGPPSIAEHKIRTVTHRHVPTKAVDQRGRDVLASVAQQDGHYLKAFDRKFSQGCTEPHFLELDLGNLSGKSHVTLYLVGWVYPTDTALNIALDESPAAPAPRPPSLSVPDKEGNWQEVIPYTGFPGGKTKCIAIDLDGKFLCDDYRVRLASSMELYWDAAFFTVDEPPAPMQVSSPLELRSAELHYRGFSAMTLGSHHGPEHFDYQTVSTAPKWPPMDGKFTRYGDVLDLLKRVDHRQVVLGSGDEISLEFQPPGAGVPQGWKRDFVIHNVGWDKDADLHTIWGQSSEPLPFVGMSDYPYGADKSYPLTPETRDYLRQYQTRIQNTFPFWKQTHAASLLPK